MIPRGIAPHQGRRAILTRSLPGGAFMVAALLITACAQFSPPSAAPSTDGEWTVDYVIDGDTIDVAGPDGSTERVRLLGIDTPEVSRDDSPGECGGEEATAHLQELLPEGTPAQLVPDSRADDEDRYGRLLRYVELEDGTDAGHELITNGRAVAWAPSGEPDPERLPDYEEATTAARQALTGSWATCPTMTAAR